MPKISVEEVSDEELRGTAVDEKGEAGSVVGVRGLIYAQVPW